MKIWNFMISQSKTCLQGTSFYAFDEFISLLKCLKGKDLDSKNLWENLCLNIRTIFDQRKLVTFRTEEKFFSLRMISTNKKLNGNSNPQEPENHLVRNSIDNHFYHFGDENDGRAVLPFNFKDGKLILDGEIYNIRSHFLKFEKDIFTIVKDYTSCLVGIFASPEASSKDYRSQEVMFYWTIANASHQNFHGKTGVEFFRNVVINLQLPIVDGLNYIPPNLNEDFIPVNLKVFLNSLSIPYLIPERPSKEFKSSLAGLCEFGVIYRCPNATGMDIGFEMFRNGLTCHSYVECKYTRIKRY